MVGAADGERESIGGVFGFRWIGEAQERLDHFLDLKFAGAPMAHNREFGFFRGKFVDGDFFSGGCEIDHPFSHAEFDGALGIFQYKLGFDRNGRRAIFFN